MDIKIREYKPRDMKQILPLVHELESELAEKFADVTIKSGIENYKNRYLKRGNKYKMFVAIVKKKNRGISHGISVSGCSGSG